jgi:ATP-dependent helicase HrpB
MRVISLVLVLPFFGSSFTVSRLRPRSFGWKLQNNNHVARDIEQALSNAETLQLPIFDILASIRSSVIEKPNLLLEAPPGAGKTSIVPLALVTCGRNTNNNTQLNNILVCEPRRVAARSAAQRMASMLHQVPGQLVGYAVRDDVKVSADRNETKVTFVTDGVLLNKVRQNPRLSGVDAVVFDEFHERGVGSDTALALCLEVQQKFRPDLNLIVMSATLLGDDATGEDNLFNALGKEKLCNILRSDGRQYPIDVQWAKRGTLPFGLLMKSRKDLVTTMCNAIEDALKAAPEAGDVLAFLPGKQEIQRVVKELCSRKIPAEVTSLYGSMPKYQQDLALYPSPETGRRVIVSSPIAEASLTLERVTCVVDSGLRREPRCDVDTGLPRLVTVRCSKASARQRAGRAGRIRPGFCIRVYTESEFENFAEHSPAEILSTDLVPTLLLLLDWGCTTVEEINQIRFIDKPGTDAIEKALETLVKLDALKGSGNRYTLTSHGRSIAQLPTHPRLATAISLANTTEALVAAVVASAILDEDTGIDARGADISVWIRNLLQGESSSGSVQDVVRYARRISHKARIAVTDVMNNPACIPGVLSIVGETLLHGFTSFVAKRKGDASYGGSAYMLSLARSARLDDTADAPEYIIALECSTGDDSIVRIRSFASLGIEALRRVAREDDVIFTVPSHGYEVRARRVLQVGAIELSSTPLPTPSGVEVTKILMDTIRSFGGVNAALVQTLSIEKRTALHEFRERIRLALLIDKAADFPACFTALDAIDSGVASNEDIEITEKLVEPWLASAGSLKAVDLLGILVGCLTNEQRVRLDREFPTCIKAPDGSEISIVYTGGTPTAHAKLQQYFGTSELLCVGPPAHRIPVALSLLSPAGTTLAVTKDLAYFWKETYPSVRAEMRGRYAKHPWPEDPMSALPTRQTKSLQQDIAQSTGDTTRKRKIKQATKRRK